MIRRSFPSLAAALVLAAPATVLGQAPPPAPAAPLAPAVPLAPAAPAPDPGEPARIRAAYLATGDPAVLLDLAASLRRLGKHVDAALVYEEYRHHPRADPARAVPVARALADIDNQVGRLVITFDDPSARIWLDGRELPLFASGNAVRVDPGDHQVSGVRGGLPPLTTTLHLEAREQRTVDLKMGTYIPPGAPVPLAQPAPAAPVAVIVPSGPIPRSGYVDAGKLTSTLLLVTGGVGLTGGIVAGAVALGIELDSRSHCLGGGLACDQDGVDIQRRARNTGGAATVALGGGAALLLAGIIVRAATRGNHRVGSTAPRVGCVAPRVRAGAAGLEVAW
jgi:hypothetical protein